MLYTTNPHLRSSVVKGEKNDLRCENSTEKSRDRLAGHAGIFVKLLSEGSVGIGLGQNIAVGLTVERIFLGEAKILGL